MHAPYHPHRSWNRLRGRLFGQRGSDPAAAVVRSGPKAITIAFPIDPIALGGSASGLGAATVPSRYFKEFTNAYLTTYNAQDEPVPWLVTELPSLDNDTWRVLDDGAWR